MPVVCVTGAFTLTPLFAHSQSAVLNQLLSPADALPYNANINFNNVEVKGHWKLLFGSFVLFFSRSLFVCYFGGGCFIFGLFV